MQFLCWLAFACLLLFVRLSWGCFAWFVLCLLLAGFRLWSLGLAAFSACYCQGLLLVVSWRCLMIPGFTFCLLLVKSILEWLDVVYWLCRFFCRLLSKLTSGIMLVCWALLWLRESVPLASFYLWMSPLLFVLLYWSLPVGLVRLLDLRFISGSLFPVFPGSLFPVFCICLCSWFAGFQRCYIFYLYISYIWYI